MAAENHPKRGGRACGTCHWFEENTDPTASVDGWCFIRFPYSGFKGQLENHERHKRKYEWCSFWVPDMSKM